MDESFDLIDWLEEGLEILTSCVRDTLDDFGEQLVAKAEEILTKEWTVLSEKFLNVVDGNQKQLQRQLDAFLPRLNQLIISLRKGADACDAPLVLMGTAHGLLEKFGSFDPAQWLIGKLDRVVDLVCTQLESHLI